MTELIKCPFCGEAGQVVAILGTSYWSPRCSDTMCILHKTDAKWHCFTREEAIADWNARHYIQVIERRIEEAEAKLRDHFYPVDIKVKEELESLLKELRG